MTNIHKAAREALETLRLARDRIVDDGGSGWKSIVTRCNRDYMALRAALSEAPTQPIGQVIDANRGANTGAAPVTPMVVWFGQPAVGTHLYARPEAPKVALTEERERQAFRLWMLLDDIDTLDDACRDRDDIFRAKVRQVQKKRFDLLDCDDIDALAQKHDGSEDRPNDIAMPEAGKEGGA